MAIVEENDLAKSDLTHRSNTLTQKVGIPKKALETEVSGFLESHQTDSQEILGGTWACSSTKHKPLLGELFTHE